MIGNLEPRSLIAREIGGPGALGPVDVSSLKVRHRLNSRGPYPPLPLRRPSLLDIKFNGDGTAVGCLRRSLIEMWSVREAEAQGQPSLMVCTHPFVPVRFDWLVDSAQLVLASDRAGCLCLFDVGASSMLGLLAGRPVGCAYDWHPWSPNRVLAASERGLLSRVDLVGNRLDLLLHAKNADGSDYDVACLAVNPLKPFEFCVAGSANHARIYDTRRMGPNPLRTLPKIPSSDDSDTDCGPDGDDEKADENIASFSSSCSLAFCKNGTRLAMCSSSDSICVYDMNMANPISRLKIGKPTKNNTQNIVRRINFFGPKSEFLLATVRTVEPPKSAGHRIRYGHINIHIWDCRNQRLVRSIPTTMKCSSFAVHPYLPTIATASHSHHSLRLWKCD